MSFIKRDNDCIISTKDYVSSTSSEKIIIALKVLFLTKVFDVDMQIDVYLCEYIQPSHNRDFDK